MTPKQVYAVEGLDRLGKSTLIQGILDKLGYYLVIHFAKPQRLKIYEDAAKVDGVPHGGQAAWHYQAESFRNSMLIASSGARIIFDRWHIGEAVYSPLYRNYSGDYVFNQERHSNLDQHPSLRLILLTENFKFSQHFVDDGKSLGSGSLRDRWDEQGRFTGAFDRSSIKDKRVVCVTAPDGNFRPKEDILEEALS